MAGVVSSTVSITYPPLPAASVFGTSVSVVNETNINSAQCFSTIAVSAPSIVSPPFTPCPIPQQSGVNNVNLFPNFTSTVLSTVGITASAAPLLNQTNLNNATVFPLFTH